MDQQAEPSKNGIISLVVMILLIILVVALSGPIYRALSGNGGAIAYTSVQQGYGGEVKVTLSVKDGKIDALTAEGNTETPGIGQKAISQYNETIFAGLLKKQVAEADTGLDAISGATYTSQAVIAGYQDVMEQAQRAQLSTESQTAH